MEIRQLEAFAAVMSTGSVTAAGRVLGRSQPAVTRAIQEFEADIGYPLFLRAGPRVTPTPQASRLYQDVERALASLALVKTRTLHDVEAIEPPLAIMATSAFAAGLVPQALASLPGHALSSSLHWRTAAPEQVVDGVLNGAMDIGVTSLPLEHRGITIHWLGESPCVAVVPANDPLANASRIALSDLACRRIVTMQNPYRLRPRLDAAFAQAGVRPPTILETNSSLNALGAVRAGLGVSVIEPASAYGLPIDGLAVRPLDVVIPFLFGVISPESRICRPNALAFVNAFAAAAALTLPGFVLHDASAHGAILQALHHGRDAQSLSENSKVAV